MGGGEITDESYIYKFAKYYCNVTARCFGLTLENHGHGYSFGCFISSPHQFTNNSTFSIVAVFFGLSPDQNLNRFAYSNTSCSK